MDLVMLKNNNQTFAAIGYLVLLSVLTVYMVLYPLPVENEKVLYIAIGTLFGLAGPAIRVLFSNEAKDLYKKIEELEKGMAIKDTQIEFLTGQLYEINKALVDGYVLKDNKFKINEIKK